MKTSSRRWSEIAITILSGATFAALFAPLFIAVGTTMNLPSKVAVISSVIVAFGGATAAYWGRRDAKRREEHREQQIAKVESEAEREPERVKFAWDLARIKLEAYFDRNLSQVNAIFIVSVAVMVIGFGLMAYAVVISLTHPQSTAAYVSAICGIITEFIGATFMAIYRSTIAQASSFMTILERINAVGMAVQILDSIPDQEIELKNKTRSEIVKLLLAANRDSFRPVTTDTSVTKPRR